MLLLPPPHLHSGHPNPAYKVPWCLQQHWHPRTNGVQLCARPATALFYTPGTALPSLWTWGTHMDGCNRCH